MITALWAAFRASRAFPYVVAALAVVGAVLGFRAKWRSDGAREERAETDAESLQKMKEMQDAAGEVDRSRDGLVDRLRSGGF